MVVFILIVLVFPAIQKEYPVFHIKKLDGDFVLAEKPAFEWTDWFDGSFQMAYDKYLEDHIGFRDFLVRLTNQIDYTFFRIPHAEGVVIGKNDQLIEADYIRAYTGEDFIGEKYIDEKIRKLKFIQAYLKKEKNIDLVLVFEPGKASFYPEFIPDKYLDQVWDNTNYDTFLEKSIAYNVDFIDFRSYFISLKGKTQYPLYPQYGIHWSTYGMTFAADSLISYIKSIRQTDLPDYAIDSLQITVSANRADYDAGRALNLLFRLPEKEQLAYPAYKFDTIEDKEKPMVLAVGDSYYWNIFNTGIPKNLFQNEAFWYFYKQIFPDSYFEPKQVADIDLKSEIEKQDVILLMITGRFLFKFGWNFIEDVYKLYGPTSAYDKIHDYKSNICNYNVWFTNIINDAKERNISVDSMLTLTAEYVYGQEDMENFLMLKGADYYKGIIMSDPIWFSAVETKSKEQNQSVDEILKKEANYNFQANYPDIYDKYKQLDSIKLEILNDSILFSDAQKFANEYYLTLQESVQIKAEIILQDSISN